MDPAVFAAGAGRLGGRDGSGERDAGPTARHDGRTALVRGTERSRAVQRVRHDARERRVRRAGDEGGQRRRRGVERPGHGRGAHSGLARRDQRRRAIVAGRGGGAPAHRRGRRRGWARQRAHRRRVGPALMVVGGGVEGRASARIGGELLQQAELLRYHLDGERLVADREPVYDDSWWRRHNVRHDFRRGEAFTEFFFVASRAYNRVEGWSFVIGPRFQRNPAWGKLNVEAFGVVRTAGPMKWDNQTLGHDAKAEVQFGRPLGVGLGARAFDVVEPTESWQLGDGEAGIASAILHRDYRDYWVRHGGAAFVRLAGGNDADLTFTFSDEQWGDRRDRDPWTLFRGRDVWRADPAA